MFGQALTGPTPNGPPGISQGGPSHIRDSARLRIARGAGALARSPALGCPERTRSRPAIPSGRPISPTIRSVCRTLVLPR